MDIAPLENVLLDLLRDAAVQQRSRAENLHLLSGAQPQVWLSWLQRHRTGPLLHEILRRERQLGLLPEALATHLKHSYKASLFQNLRQTALIGQVAEVFEREAIPWVVLKGHHIGRILYPSPSCRPSMDVDILVPRAARDGAIQRLLAVGFKLRASLQNISHEVTLSANYGSVDLHWDLCRPGRVDSALTRQLLGTRNWSVDRWIPSDELTLTYLAIHNTFTEHVTRRWIRLLDVDRWIRMRQVSWQSFEAGVAVARAKVAAWSTLRWCQHMLHTPIPQDVLDRLQPKKLRRGHLDARLVADPYQHYCEHPIAAQFLFSMMLADDLSGMISTVGAWAGCRMRARREFQQLMVDSRRVTVETDVMC